jgi:hypothetical protein
VNRRLIDQRDRNRRRNDDVLRIVREIRAEVDDLWMKSAGWTRADFASRAVLAYDLASYGDTSAKRAMRPISEGLETP